jgi:hypothetical protein
MSTSPSLITARNATRGVVPACVGPDEGGSILLSPPSVDLLHASPARLGSGTHRLSRLRGGLFEQMKARSPGRHYRSWFPSSYRTQVAAERRARNAADAASAAPTIAAAPSRHTMKGSAVIIIGVGRHRVGRDNSCMRSIYRAPEKEFSPKFDCSGGGYNLAIVGLKRQLIGYATAP